MVATGVGAALAGLHPIVDLNFVDFAFGAMDEIVNQGAKVEFMLSRPCLSSSGPRPVWLTAGRSTTTASKRGSCICPGWWWPCRRPRTTRRG